MSRSSSRGVGRSGIRNRQRRTRQRMRRTLAYWLLALLVGLSIAATMGYIAFLNLT